MNTRKFKCSFSLMMDDDMQAEFVVTEEQYKILEQLEEQLLNQCSCVHVGLRKIDNEVTPTQKGNYIASIYSNLLNIEKDDYYIINLRDGYEASIWYNPFKKELSIISIENDGLHLSYADIKDIQNEIIGML